MKKPQDPRHLLRKKTVERLFAYSFRPDIKPEENIRLINIVNKLDKIDGLIQSAAPQFPVDKIAKIDVAILRLAVYELCIEKSAPPKVVIDEAIELAKEFGGEGSPGFINGALGTLLSRKI